MSVRHRALGLSAVSIVLVTTALVACSSGTGRSGFDTEQGSAATDPSKQQQGGFGPKADTDGGNAAAGCDPGYYDVPGNGMDEDCSGVADDADAPCDTGLAIDSSDPYDAAKALGLCQKADAAKGSWGIVDAKFVRPDGSPANVNLDVGLLKGFGTNAPQAGERMLVLSSGYARAPGDPGYKAGLSRDKNVSHGAPSGYPKEFAGCPGVETGNPRDGIALELKILTPKNAKTISYDQNFFTYEFPMYICSEFNDFYVTLLQPKLPNLPDENIAFDSQNNPISVNNAFLQACKPQTAGGKKFTCPAGQTPLKNTGFDEALAGPHAATGWLTTQAPVEGGKEITLRFAIWDSGDGNLDSTILLDNFTWSADAVDAPVTAPVK